jgi:hypothetical protein
MTFKQNEHESKHETFRTIEQEMKTSYGDKTTDDAGLWRKAWGQTGRALAQHVHNVRESDMLGMF